MPPYTDTKPHSIKIDFLQDTLFGVNTFSFEGSAQLMPSTTLPSPTLRLLITPPWPAQLEDAHTVTFNWEGTPHSGTVQSVRCEADGRLSLNIDPQA